MSVRVCVCIWGYVFGRVVSVCVYTFGVYLCEIWLSQNSVVPFESVYVRMCVFFFRIYVCLGVCVCENCICLRLGVCFFVCAHACVYVRVVFDKVLRVWMCLYVFEYTTMCVYVFVCKIARVAFIRLCECVYVSVCSVVLVRVMCVYAYVCVLYLIGWCIWMLI